MLLPRDVYSQPPDQPSDPDNNNSKTTQIIIGVVVGGVAALAITAGILFLLVKKRKWDRIRRYEERLIDYQLAAGQSSKSRSVTPEDHYLNMMPPRPSSTFSSYYPVAATATRTRATSVPEAPPPSYQTLHPRYDPSQYQGVRMSTSASPSNNTAPTRSSRGLSLIRPIVGLDRERAFPSHGRRSESLSAPLPSAIRPQSHLWYQQPPLPQPDSSLGRPSGEWQLSNAGSSSRSGPAASTTTTITGGASGSRRPSEDGPRRPKPVLSKLITNF